MSFIRFDYPEPKDIFTESNRLNDFCWDTFSKIASRIFPDGNPDFGELHEKVHYWWLELDDTGYPIREVGFDLNDQAIVIGPFGENYGFMTDCNTTFKATDFPSVNSSRFEEHWKLLSESLRISDSNP